MIRYSILGESRERYAGGRIGIITGATTGAAFCTALQLCYNEFVVTKVKYAIRNLERTAQSVAVTPPDDTSDTSDPSSPTPELIPGRVLRIFGIKKISDEEYLAQLKDKRERHLARIRELEKRNDERRKSNSD